MTLRIIKNIFLAAYLFTSFSECFAQRSLQHIQALDWKSMNKTVPKDSVILLVKSILLNANKYAITTWFYNDRNYKADSSGYLDLQSVSPDNEYRYRLPAGMAFALAISLKTGVYDPAVTGVSKQEAQLKTIQLISSVAYDHVANSTRKVWGGDWQAAHWAYYDGYAAWLLWDQLTPESRQNIQAMIISEADHLLTQPVLFYKDQNGKSIILGDSKIEENNWNAELLYLAAMMMPKHLHHQNWYNKAIAYMIAAVAMPTDLTNETMLHGKKVKDWITGYNVEEPGIVINHHIIHPLYNALSSVVNAPIVFSLANAPTPEAARFNIGKIYSSLINTKFDPLKYEQPGGTMYIIGSTQVYYPQGSDWGKEIYDSFANMDIAAWQYKLDKAEKFDGKYWAFLHLKPIAKQQSRFDDGHTYLNKQENSYYGKEAAIATRMASAWMSIWLQNQRPVNYKDMLLN